MAAPTTNNTLITSGGVEITVERRIAECSIVIRDMISDLGDLDEPIPISDTEESVLRKVLEWCAYHQNDPAPTTEGRNPITSIPDWDQKFMAELDSDMLHRVIKAANYLEINLLIEIGCKTVADMIKGKSSEDIRQILDVENDFTPEEEARIHRDNEWVKDTL
jgi:S-phase kinase-associated protein 1